MAISKSLVSTVRMRIHEAYLQCNIWKYRENDKFYLFVFKKGEVWFFFFFVQPSRSACRWPKTKTASWRNTRPRGWGWWKDNSRRRWPTRCCKRNWPTPNRDDNRWIAIWIKKGGGGEENVLFFWYWTVF